MVGRNYDMCTSRGPGDLVETIQTDFQSSSRRDASEAIGKFQYLGDGPLEATDSLTGSTRVSELQVLLYDLFRLSLHSSFIWCGRVMSNLSNHLMNFD
jgi:hypothetical protein